jgi:putative spermidine/putrescine transport system substrate-binding protein
VNPAPTSWSDLWNPQYKGRIAVADMVANYGLAFFAYMNRANGGTESNAAPGWARVRDLVASQQPLIYQTDDQAVTAVTQEGAVLVVMPNSRAIQLAKQGLPIGFVFPKEGGFGWGNYGGIPVGATHQRLAEEFINFWLSPEVQTNWAMAIGYSPTNLKSRIPSNYAYNRYLLSPNDYSKIQALDWAWINKNRAAWIEKWQQDVLPLVRH